MNKKPTHKLCKMFMGNESDEKAVFVGSAEECRKHRDKFYPKYVIVRLKT
jgi:hypothetical protein